MSTYYFCGVGGNGMSPLARLLVARGHRVLGSDRACDRGENAALFAHLTRDGVVLVPQDGSAVNHSIDFFVVTRAVEESIPDIARARALGLRIIKRPLLMAELFSASFNVAVGGTAGKSTTTGMIGRILTAAGRTPTIMNGAVMLDSGTNMVAGSPDLAVFEADESDGRHDVVGVCPRSIAVVTNISLDHFEVSELKDIFGEFVRAAAVGAVVNRDCPNSRLLEGIHPRTVTFSETGPADVCGRNLRLELTVPGHHNRANALAAIAACTLVGIAPAEGAGALAAFKGMHRRLELVGRARGIEVFDDFASNPGKIEASLVTLQQRAGRLIVVFQPHGFQPTRMMKAGYIEVFSRCLRPDDLLLIPPIFYAGGTANLVDGQVVPLPTDISSHDVAAGVAAQGRNARAVERRSDLPAAIAGEVRSGDVVVVMGSRDESLAELAREILGAM